MDDDDWLAQRFEAHRPHLRAVAFRILGSLSDAEDAVQEAWLRLSRSDTSEVENLGGWLTTVVARVSLNLLQTRRSRREDPQGARVPDELAGWAGTAQPEDEALLSDSVGPALLVILDSLEPAERLAFVLHDLFAVPFDEIAPIVGRSPAAARQLASRARRRVRGAEPPRDADRRRQREVVAAFLTASRNGQFDALLALLDPRITLRADDATVRMGASSEVLGARAVAETFSGRARGARLALIDGAPGALWAVDGRPRVAFRFTVAAGKILAITMTSDPATLSTLDMEVLTDEILTDPAG
ncbi:sigma-70 family RNA polymerase sigma factor [Pengzhenrongella frigida]|uniref:Sigma-70 family RNA polymerase sigma factor n=1 Tax=Pengzhenrongella frigida TaxID=1259133 RepID=A0A4Q5N2V5_9MICO|nr:sigma-70 family RNA polymerase sigma factor [Cellulomonas sp. HLT2-17]RYV51583.1 sigma-70 family RNA polymerase sigma factor [Cellulomonas sp. HLT2-17]